MNFVILFPVLFFFLMLTISVSMNVWDALDERVNEINSKHTKNTTDDLTEYPFELTVVEEALEDDYLSDDFYYT